MSGRRVLFVDDDENVLSGYRRALRREYQVETALGGSEGLRLVTEHGPFAVVVSDMRMPGMDGIELLRRVRDLAPESVRMMLTGNSDQETAIQAVNEGQIFRFLTKPCPPATVARALADGVRQYELVTAERDLLERTLQGSVQVLVDLLSLVSPIAFGRAMRLREYACHVARALKLPETWRFEVAALLSQVGYVTLPADVLEKVARGERLAAFEEKMVSGHAEVASRLIGNIPRLEVVAEIIAGQEDPCDEIADPEPDLHLAKLGGQILRSAMAFDSLVLGGASPADAAEALRRERPRHGARILEALGSVPAPAQESAVLPRLVRELRSGMALAEDVRTRSGMLVVTRGQVITEALLTRLLNFSILGNIEEPLRVHLPRDAAGAAGRPEEAGS